MAFLTIAQSPLGKTLPCNFAGFSARCTLPLKDPEPPRKASNLSPKPSPTGAGVRRRRLGSASVVCERVRASVVCSGLRCIGQPGYRCVRMASTKRGAPVDHDRSAGVVGEADPLAAEQVLAGECLVPAVPP